MSRYDDVMRTIIDLSEDQLAALDAWRLPQGLSRAEAVRRAVARMVGTDDARRRAIDAAFGLWRDRRAPDGQPMDGLMYQERLRDDWDDR